MKAYLTFIFILFICTMHSSGQSKVTSGDLIVFTDQGWVMKAQNTGTEYISFRITYVTEGRNNANEVVSSTKEQSDLIGIGPGETMQLFTAPQDPQKKTKYTFKYIVISECSANKGKCDVRGINTRMNGGN